MLIAVIAVAFVVLLVLGLFALALGMLAMAAFLRRRPQPAPANDERPVQAPAFSEPTSDDPATELFDRSKLFAVYDADDVDQTETLHLEAGILIDGNTDPAGRGLK